MKPSRLGLGLALMSGLILGALGGFLVGRGGRTASDARALIAVAPVPPTTATPTRLGHRSDSAAAAAAAASRNAAIDLSGLPPGEAWGRLMDIRDPVAKANAVARLLDSMPPAEWPVWLAKMIDSFKDEDIDGDDPTAMAALFGTIDALFQRMVATHPRECVSAMLSLDKNHSHGDDLIEGLMSSWARHDLESARQFYETEIAGRKHGKEDDIAKSLVREMAKADPKGTLEWAASLTDDGARAHGVMMAFEAIAKADRSEAISLLTTRSDLPARSKLAEQIAWRWAKSEPGQALEWAQTLPEDLRGPAAKRAFEGFGNDFSAARAAFDASPPEVRDVLLPALVANAPKDQIGAVADLVAREPIAAGRAEASRRLMRQWAEHDPTAASGWLAGLPAGDVQDHAIVGFLGWADGNEPQAALEWAGTISEPGLRTEQLDALMNRFRGSDPTMARAWINSTTRLSADERTRFLEVTGR